MTTPLDDAWTTPTEETLSRTCTCTLGPLTVQHGFRLARHGGPGTVVTRTYEPVIQWTSTRTLDGWLGDVAETLTPYVADRFGTGDGAGGPGADARSAGGERSGAAGDGRFLAAPVDATVRPAGTDPLLAEPYHFWNTPLARLLEEAGYPGAVTSVTLDLVDGPTVHWDRDATAGGVDPDALPEPTRVGVEYAARQRLRRIPDDGDGTRDAGAEGIRDAETGHGRGIGWSVDDDDFRVDREGLARFVAATRAVPDGGDEGGGDGVDGDGDADPLAAVAAQVDAVAAAFRWDGEGDPFAIDEATMTAATTSPRGDGATDPDDGATGEGVPDEDAGWDP